MTEINISDAAAGAKIDAYAKPRSARRGGQSAQSRRLRCFLRYPEILG
jgi:hypothetical protein